MELTLYIKTKMNEKELSPLSESSAKIAYDRLGQKYYFGFHPTSRIFDNIISQYIEKNPIYLEPNNIYLEVGCGKSRLVDMCKDKSIEIIIMDISQEMLLNSKEYFDQINVQAIIASASYISLSANSITGIYSFLGDPFNHPFYFQESYRVLKNNGEFLHIIPNYIWATTLRKSVDIPINTTEFLDNGDRIIVPSFVLPDSQIKEELEKIGFIRVMIKDLFLPYHIKKGKIPEHILIPIKSLNIELYKLPILTAIHAIK